MTQQYLDRSRLPGPESGPALPKGGVALYRVSVYDTSAPTKEAAYD